MDSDKLKGLRVKEERIQLDLDNYFLRHNDPKRVCNEKEVRVVKKKETKKIKTGLVTLATVEADAETSSLIERADKFLGEIGYTEHGFRHANLVAHIARNIMYRLSFPEREAELAAIAGYLHDIGNVISREFHEVSGALISRSILKRLGMSYSEIAVVMNAIGNHEEEHGCATSSVAAALIIADKSDVHRSRVRSTDQLVFDIHDRVNYAAQRSFLNVNPETCMITLEIEIDTSISQVMEYFEIFLSRMVMCRNASKFLDCKFSLVINKTQLL